MKGLQDKNRFCIKTLGCKVNQYESQAMREVLLRAGFRECIADELADIYIVNTCTVTHRADRESRNLVGLFHRKNPEAKIVVIGCYAERDENLLSSLPGVTRVLKNEDKPHIADMIRATRRLKSGGDIFSGLSISDFKDRTKAYVKIQDGCDNSCSYCKVSIVRGRSRSRPLKDIVEESERLLDKGFKEIVLSGICLGAWGRDLAGDLGLTDVLIALQGLRGRFRIRLSSIEPQYVTDGLIDHIASNRRICPHLHIPLQSGDDETLKKMNRPYTVMEFKALIDKIRKAIPAVAITTDVMVGFPGESDESFNRTLAFIKDIRPSRIHIFPYSSREGTAAYKLPGAPDEKKLRKWCSLLKVTALISSYIYRMNFLNKKVEVLVETTRDRESGMLAGYTDTYIRVLFEGPDSLMRSIVPITIAHLTLTKTVGTYEPG